MSRKYAVAVTVVLMTLFMFLSFSLGKSAEYKLNCRNMSDEAAALFGYIVGLDGEKTLSGQQESTWMDSEDYEMEYIFESAGVLPVIRGFDYMNDDFEGVNRRAELWWNRGGIVTICWHCGSDFSGEWKDCMESEVADWNKMLTKGTDEYNKMLDGMDKAARALNELKEKGIPVLWRPFHEFDGNWFWWSKGGADNFKKLWKIMYERYTDYWGLNNLIWVLGFSDQGERSVSWYPGDEYCDILGADTYSENMFDKLYRKMYTITSSPKPICLHECGKNPTVKEIERTGYSWFMTWHTEYLVENNSAEQLKELYNSDKVISLDEFELRK